MRELTVKEIEQVSGGVANFAIGAGIGAFVGGLDYGISTLGAGRPFSWGRFAVQTAAGAVGGLTSSVAAVRVAHGAVMARRYAPNPMGGSMVRSGLGWGAAGAGTMAAAGFSQSRTGSGTGQGGGCW